MILKSKFFEFKIMRECANFCGLRAIVGLFPSYHCPFVGISWARDFFSWNFSHEIFFRGNFVGTIVFSCGYFVDAKVLIEDISWALAANFLIQKFSVVGMRESDRK